MATLTEEFTSHLETHLKQSLNGQIGHLRWKEAPLSVIWGQADFSFTDMLSGWNRQSQGDCFGFTTQRRINQKAKNLKAKSYFSIKWLMHSEGLMLRAGCKDTHITKWVSVSLSYRGRPVSALVPRSRWVTQCSEAQAQERAQAFVLRGGNTSRSVHMHLCVVTCTRKIMRK